MRFFKTTQQANECRKALGLYTDDEIDKMTGRYAATCPSNAANYCMSLRLRRTEMKIIFAQTSATWELYIEMVRSAEKGD